MSSHRYCQQPQILWLSDKVEEAHIFEPPQTGGDIVIIPVSTVNSSDDNRKCKSCNSKYGPIPTLWKTKQNVMDVYKRLLSKREAKRGEAEM